MAMNTTRLPVRMTVLTVLLIAVALIPPEHYGGRNLRRMISTQANPFATTRAHLGRQLKQARTDLYFAARAAEALATPSREAGPIVAVTPDFPAELADYLVPRLTAHWTQLGGRSDVRIAAHLSLDTAGYSPFSDDSLRARDSGGIVEPDRDRIRRSDWRVRPTSTADGATCVISVTIGPWSLDGLEGSPPWSDPAYILLPNRSIDAPPGLGPCGFVAAFGAPGRHVTAWLDSTDYTFARVAEWSARHPHSVDSVRALATYWDRRDVSVRACAAGKLDGCRRALRRAPWTWFYPRGRFTSHADGWYGFDHDYASFREHAPFLLSDLVHDVGPEAFGRFWRSDLPLEDAFREATGRDLDAWVAAWTQEYVGEFPHSPRVGGVTLLLALLGSGLALGFAVVVNQRR